MAGQQIELNEDSTSEDIEAAVDELIADRHGEASLEGNEETTSEETSDAEKVGKNEVTKERDTADEERTESTSESETTGEGKSKQSDEDWRDDMIAEASAYGFSEEDVAEFETREEFDRAIKLFDRQMDAERKKLLDEPGKKQAEGETTPEETPSDSQASKPQDGRYVPKLNRDLYEEEIVDEFTRMSEHYEARLAAIEQRFQEEADRAEEERFDRSVDDMSFAKLFGKTGEESKEEMQRRTDLYERVRIEQQVLSRMGRPVGDYNALVRRVARGLFPDDFDKKLIKNHTRRVSRQSQRRQGGGATRPTDPPATVREEMRELYKELEQAG